MNYYIQGDAAKAEQIKAAFEKKGIYSSCNFQNENHLYYSYDGTVNFCFIGGGLAYNIKTHPDYQELELPVEPKFKVGDWLAANEPNNYARFVYIEGIEDSLYLTSKIGGAFGSVDRPCITFVEEYYHPFSTKDVKDGDILHHSCTASNGTFIFKGVDESGKILCYCDYDSEDHFCLGKYHHIPHSLDSRFLYPATKEQRELLFAKMKEAGYEWDADKKELKKIQPHYDISNFQPFDKVLVRDRDIYKWKADYFSHHAEADMFMCVGSLYKQCIPFNEYTKHLLGTTDMCDECYVNW